MSAQLTRSEPRRIKATHRRRRKIASGRFVQRYYDPQIGRFLTVDPVTPDWENGGNFNRYKYAANNPYRFTDPDGRCESIGTCQMERDDMDVAEGRMTPQERDERMDARGGGALAGIAMVVGAEAGIYGGRWLLTTPTGRAVALAIMHRISKHGHDLEKLGVRVQEAAVKEMKAAQKAAKVAQEMAEEARPPPPKPPVPPKPIEPPKPSEPSKPLDPPQLQ